MREIDRPIKKSRRGGRTSGSYNRPHSIYRNGRNIDLHPAFYSDKPVKLVPNCRLKSLLRNDPKSSNWVPDGLSHKPAQRHFDYDRSQWALQGFTSPFKSRPDSKARYGEEYNLWRHWSPLRPLSQEELYLNPEDLRYGRFGDRRNGGNDGHRRGRSARGEHHHRQQPYSWQGYDHDQRRPSYRGRQCVDVRDPRNRPPPTPEIREVLMDGKCEISARDGRWCTVRGFPISERFPPNSQPGISPLRGNGGRQGPSRHRGGDHLRPPRPGRRPRIFDDYNTRDAGRPFLPNRAFPGREEDEDEEDEEDFRSQSSNHSFVRTRLSPDIVYPLPPPYHGRPLRTTRRAGRYDHDTDGEDEDVDEHFRRRGAHMGRRRASFGLGRERFLGGGRRDYEDDGLGHTFGGDEDDVFDV